MAGTCSLGKYSMEMICCVSSNGNSAFKKLMRIVGCSPNIFLKMYLNTHSYYSLRYGTMSPETLLKQAQQMGVSAMALTDINSTSASLDFVRLSEKYKLRPILGVDGNSWTTSETALWGVHRGWGTRVGLGNDE